MNFSNYSIIDQKGKRFLKVGSELLQNTIESKKQIKQSRYTICVIQRYSC